MGDELKVCLVLLIANLVRALVSGQASTGPLAAGAFQALAALGAALSQLSANPYLCLFLVVVLAQGAGWVGVIMTLGWAEVMRIQTGKPAP